MGLPLESGKATSVMLTPGDCQVSPNSVYNTPSWATPSPDSVVNQLRMAVHHASVSVSWDGSGLGIYLKNYMDAMFFLFLFLNFPAYTVDG